MLTEQEITAILLSLRVAFVATLIALPFAIAIAVVLARKRFPGHILLDAFVHLPLVLPPVVIGYFLLLGFGRRGLFGHVLESWFGLILSFRWTGAALACAVMGFPLMVRAIRLSVEAVDARLEGVAATLGAPAPMVFATITLPLILPGLLAGSVLGFARALGEFGATITFVGNIPGETQTIPTAIYTHIQVPGGDLAALRLTLISIVIAFAALLASEVLARRSLRRARGR